MSLAVLAHLFSVLFLKAYRKPRELTWYTGFAMLGLVLGFGFSGYLLPWNELSYFATAVGTDSVKSVPVVGPWLLRVLRGGEEVSVQTLYRFFALHVCILPLVMARVHRRPPALHPAAGHGPAARGRARRARRSRARGMPFFPNFALRDLLLWVICLNVLALLAVVASVRPGHPGHGVGARREGEPAEAGLPGHQARVVLPVGLPDAQGVSGASSRAWKGRRPACFWRASSAAIAFCDPAPRPQRGEGQAEPALHGPRRRRTSLPRVPDAQGVGRRRPRAAGQGPGGRSRPRGDDRADRGDLDHRDRARRDGRCAA